MGELLAMSYELLASGRLRKNSLVAQILTSAAKAAIQNKTVIAALKRCATRNRLADRLFPQPASFQFSEKAKLNGDDF
jgi:hypothetical protein